MNYTEVKIYVKTEDTERASNIAVMAVPYGIYIEDYSDLEEAAWEIAHIDLIDEDLLQKDRAESIVHIYIEEGNNPAEAVSFISDRLTAEKITFRIETDGCSEEDWADKWKAFFKPTPVGERLFVRPIWIDEYDAGDRAVLNIEPGAAFGTGTHETTRLCLETLDKIIKDGDTVLDIGCGSGILAIASMLLGAKEGFGVDIDPLAVKTAKENGLMNNFKEPELTFVCGDLDDKITDTYDIVIANIVADIIIRLCDSVPSKVKDGGYFIASGIIDARADETVSAIENAGFTIIDKIESNGWVCVVSKK